jgi:hypothetical protein
MNSELISSWAEHDSSLLKILELASQTLCIFDADLSKLRLDRPANVDLLRRFLSSDKQHRLRIAVKNAEPFRRDSPRLMKLLAIYTQSMTMIECPPHLASLNDSMCIADDRHALIRFHTDSVRAKIIIDNIEECAPYVQRFEDILKEGGEQVCASTLGL